MISVLLCALALLFALGLRGAELSSGTTIEARLLVSTGSSLSRVGDAVEASVIAPLFADGHVAIPQGAIVSGVVDQVQHLGFGLKHNRATIKYRFDSLRYPTGEVVPIETRLIDVETAKEHVDPIGLVRGINPFANISSAVSMYAWGFLRAEPELAIPAYGVKALIARTPDPEIHFPAGTEIVLRLTNSLQVPESVEFTDDASPGLSADEMSSVGQALSRLSTLQAEKSDGSRSDLANIVFLGSREEIERAFKAAGWVSAQRGSARTLYCIYQGMVERIGYKTAPMSKLTLDGAPTTASFEKGLDTFSKRHHLRLWQQPGQGGRVWVSAASEDVAIRMRRMRMTHVTDSHIDNERAKVVNDLAFAGCVDATTLLSSGSGKWNQSHGGSIVTDGGIAVIRLNDCRTPREMPLIPPPDHNRLLRGLVAFRNDFVRCNVIVAGYNTVKLLALRPAKGADTLLAKAAPHQKKSKPEDQTVWVRTSLLDIERPRDTVRPSTSIP
jgi:hypothetical protein